MTVYLWCLIGSVVLSGALLVWAWLTGRERASGAHRPEHTAANRTGETEPLGWAPGPVSEWPWGQRPSRYMLDERGHLTGPLSDPHEWMRSVLRRIDRQH